ncbi:hypothetical protein Aperf_G00000075803 [Anoplocephala perfoliata]
MVALNSILVFIRPLSQNAYRASLSASTPGLQQSRLHHFPHYYHPHQNYPHQGSRSSTLFGSISESNVTTNTATNDTASVSLSVAPSEMSDANRSDWEASDMGSVSAVEAPTFVRLAPYFESIPNRKYASLSRLRQRKCVNLANDPSLRSLHSMDDLHFNGILGQPIMEVCEPVTELARRWCRYPHTFDSSDGTVVKPTDWIGPQRKAKSMVLHQRVPECCLHLQSWMTPCYIGLTGFLSFRVRITRGTIRGLLDSIQNRNLDSPPLCASTPKQQSLETKSEPNPIPIINPATGNDNIDSADAHTSNLFWGPSRLWRCVLITGGLSLFIVFLGTTLASEAGFQGPLLLRIRTSHLFTNWEAYCYHPIRSLLSGLFQ